ncbi:hypothetical protein [Aliarcobacter butzleri]|uniref:hypothetical protein n=1 Tax=Aliarcobacter butzleri TaxID=28197 RepID=UPI002B24EF5B|nr:hypothetical protein [Aliarcobacter butzleri]
MLLVEGIISKSNNSVSPLYFHLVDCSNSSIIEIKLLLSNDHLTPSIVITTFSFSGAQYAP